MMTKGIINLSVVPVRAENSDKAEIVTQALFGELLEVLEKENSWVKIKLIDDHYEGWIDVKQYLSLSDEEFEGYKNQPRVYLGEYITYAFDSADIPLVLPLGVQLPYYRESQCQVGDVYSIEADIVSNRYGKDKIVELAHMFLNTPYLWGGKSVMGIDCSGLTQLTYKIAGHSIPRDAYQQAELGYPLSFIEEAEPGDLAFFDNQDGKIIHVGIVLSGNRILHAHGKVRIDHLDHSGIFNADMKRHTHKLRVIKRIIEE